ncbi:MAG TPA: hypothetical protein VES97_07085, partial [Solirubrobacteraceae bacterium]|nr:hypothetical protein [Solirubrobacteraceae bacterium]
EGVVFGAGLWLIARTLRLPLPRPGRIWRTALAAGLLAAALDGLRLAHGSLAALAAAACVCYPALLFGLRALGRDDVRALVRRGTVA